MERNYGIRLRWLSNCCYEIDCGGIHIVTDPHITLSDATDLTYEDIEGCDILALTHTHWDHATDVPNVSKKFGPLILCPEQSMTPLAQWLDYNPSRIYPMYPDAELDFGDVAIRPLFARHVNLKKGLREANATFFQNHEALEVPGLYTVHPSGTVNCLSYLFTLNNGTKLLFWLGNLSKEQFPLCAALKPNIAILQMATTPRGMSQRADFAAELGAQVIMLHHQEVRKTYYPEGAEEFGDVLRGRAPHLTYINPRHGEWITL